MSQPSRDALDLADFGYRQRLQRSLGGFSSFAMGFSYLSILTGLPQLFYLGFHEGGPAFFWTWPAVFVGQFLVALCFAELAARYPLSGGVYQWSRRVGPGWLGWMAGWVYLCTAVIALASVALALQPVVAQLAVGLGWLDSAGDSARDRVIVGCGLIAASTLINAVGVKVLARLNNAGAIVEMLGAALLIGLLTLAARRGLGVVLETQGRGAGESLGYLGPFLGAGLTATFVMYGFDTAGALAEETHDPRRKAPRAILACLLAVGGAGALLILAALRAAPDLADPRLGTVGGGLPMIVREVLGETVGTALLVTIALAVVVCTLTVQAAAVRLVFAMARDNRLPFSARLATLGASQAPALPAVVIGLVAVVVLAVNLDFARVMEAMASVSIVWANLAYLMVTLPMLVRRLGRRPLREASGGFSLGRWGLPVNLLATCWGLLVVANTAWPRAAIYGDGPWGRYLAPIATAAMLAVGGIYYLASRRSRAGVLDEHRAPSLGPVADAGAGV